MMVKGLPPNNGSSAKKFSTAGAKMSEATRIRRELRLLGGVRVLSDLAEDITAEVRPRHLSVLVVLAGSESIGREALIRLLWPEHDPERARNNLSQVLHGLRRVLGDEAIVAGRADVRLSRDHVESDLWRFQRKMAEGRPEA